MARSNAFLWTEAALQVQEHHIRIAPVGQEASRTLVLATVAADIFLGYSTLLERAQWLPSLVLPKDWKLQHQRGAARVQETAASLGGALIKACQFASTRPDLLPPTYIRPLAQLQDRRPSRPWSEMEGLDDKRAWSKSTGMAVMEKAVAAIARLACAFQLQPILDYLKETLPLELDFKHEAAALTELRTVIGHRSDVLIPTSVPELSTEDVLVMDFIDGIKITDRQTLVNAGISPHAVAQLLNDLYADQMLHLGILHGDPHPGNLSVQPGPRLVLLDHGLTVPLTPSRVDSLRRMVQSLTRGDFDELTKALAGAGIQFNEQVDINALLRLVGVVLGLIVGITKQLDPELDTLEIIARYF